MPIDIDTARDLIKDGRGHRNCCGTYVEDPHLPECAHFQAVARPERCPDCDMIGFHHADCRNRGEATPENPKHYDHPSGVETIDVGRCMTFTSGSAFKYILRYEAKVNPPEDLRKCRWYVADIDAYDDPIWINEGYEEVATPLLERMLAAEMNPYRRRFFEAVLDQDVAMMAEVVEDARLSVA